MPKNAKDVRMRDCGFRLKMAALLTEEYIEKRAKRARSKKFRKVLKKIPDVEPEDYDRIYTNTAEQAVA